MTTDHAHTVESSAAGCSCGNEKHANRNHASAEAPGCPCNAPIKLTDDSDAHAGHDHDHSHGGEGGGWVKSIAIPGVLFAAGLIGRHWLALGDVPFYGLMLLAYILCGWPVLKEAFAALRRGDVFNEFTLMSLATLVAIGIGEMAEAVGVMLFYSIGELVQDKAAGQSRNSIKSLLASKPDNARMMVDGREVATRPEKVPVGSVVLVKPGDKVPLDGVVKTGAAHLDMSSITGESRPEPVEAGGKVYSGAICLDGDLMVETTAKASESMVGKILAMVENAVAMKSKTERFITTFSRYYTPVVVLLAVLVAVIPPLFFAGDWHQWIYRGLVLLVVSCPCALLLSVPLAYFAGIGRASRHGILVKGGQVFDALVRARTVVMDKTGTLTEGKMSLAAIETAPGIQEKDVLALAAMAESRSNHPLAKAVMAAAGESGIVNDDVTLRDVAGKGVVAQSPQGEILVGNAALLRDNGVAFDETTSSNTAVYVALNGKYQGCLTFSDKLKADSVAAMQGLRRGGRVSGLYMLTGDREETAAAVAKETGLDGYRAGLLPDGKVAAFSSLSPDRRGVFVGDGVNDAPLLAAAGVGVAMGALGSAAAVEAADAVILDDSLSRLQELFAIAWKTRRIAVENIIFALAVKAAIMILGVLGISGLWAAVFADVGVALIAVLNSLRLIRGE